MVSVHDSDPLEELEPGRESQSLRLPNADVVISFGKSRYKVLKIGALFSLRPLHASAPLL